MKEVLLIKNGELALKGLNRRTFEDMLIKNMKTGFYEQFRRLWKLINMVFNGDL